MRYRYIRTTVMCSSLSIAKAGTKSKNSYMATSAGRGIAWPPFAALGENVCQRSLNRTSAWTFASVWSMW